MPNAKKIETEFVGLPAAFCNFALLFGWNTKQPKTQQREVGDSYQMEQSKFMGALSNQQPQQKHEAKTTILLPETDSNPANFLKRIQMLVGSPYLNFCQTIQTTD